VLHVPSGVKTQKVTSVVVCQWPPSTTLVFSVISPTRILNSVAGLWMSTNWMITLSASTCVQQPRSVSIVLQTKVQKMQPRAALCLNSCTLPSASHDRYLWLLPRKWSQRPH